VPAGYGNWSTIYDRYRTWAGQSVFENLMRAAIDEAAARGEVDLDLVSVDSTTCRAHHHAAGMVVAPERLQELERAAAAEKGLHRPDKPGPMIPGPTLPSGNGGAGCAGAAGPG
jgi:hypothetical protein